MFIVFFAFFNRDVTSSKSKRITLNSDGNRASTIGRLIWAFWATYNVSMNNEATATFFSVS
jgi:hypothetical protein